MLIDVHVHSSYTEGVEVDARTILEAARDAGLDGICFTDRDSTKNAVELIKLGAEVGVEVFIGLEIQTDHGVMLGFAPRIDSFYLEEEWRQLQAHGTASAQQVVNLFNRIGGAVVAAYPYDMNIPWASGDRLFSIEGLTSVEIFVPRLAQSRNSMAIESARALGTSRVGGSDFKGDLSAIGTAATLFPTSVGTQAQLVAALKRDCWAVAIGVELKKDEPRPERRDDRRRGGRGGRDGDRRGGRGGRDGERRGGRGGRDGGGRGGRDGDRRGGRGGRDGDKRGGRDGGGRGGRDGDRRGGRDGERRGGRDGDRRRRSSRKDSDSPRR